MRWWIAVLCVLPAQEDPNPVDVHLEARGAVADDAVYLRRITLDLAGRLPREEEIRAFLKTRDRAKEVDRLLASDDAALYFADLWMQWLFDYDFEIRDLYAVDFSALHAWLKAQFKEDRPYDGFVRALLADRGERKEKPAVNFPLKHVRRGEPPVKLAVMSARLFLGRDIRCAQCHDDPFVEGFKQEHFWGYVGFFRPLYANGYELGERENQTYSGMIADHMGEKRVPPRFLDGRVPEKGERTGDALARLTLSMPESSRSIVDRLWRLLMARPIPEKLLAPLADDFEKRGRSVRRLLRRTVLSRAYQLSSAGSGPAREKYEAGPLKAMNLVQFMNSFSDAFDLHKWHEEMYRRGVKDPKALEIFKDREVMRLFFHKWSKDMVFPKGSDPEVTSSTGTVRLALKLMNNDKIQSMVYSGWGTLSRVLSKKSRPADRIELLFLTLLGRFPTRGESERFVAHVEGATLPEKAYEDLFWVLVNSSEFLFVH